MLKDYMKIFVICLILFLTIGMVSATENTDDVNGTDTLTVVEDSVDDTETQDVLSVSDENVDVICASDEEIVGDYEGFDNIQNNLLAVSDDGGDKLGYSTGFDRIINDAQDGDTIVMTQDYRIERGPGLNITVSLTIDGQGHKIFSSLSRLFNISHSDVVFKNIVFDCTSSSSYGNGGAIYCTGDNVQFINCFFDVGNYVPQGGAIYFEGTNYTIKNCTFEECNAGSAGGAIYSKGLLTIDDCNFTGQSLYTDTKTCGGAIYAEDVLIVKNSKFYNNRCRQASSNKIENYGGVIYAEKYLEIENSTFENNYLWKGAGCVIYAEDNVLIKNSTFNKNHGYAVNNKEVNGGVLYVNGNLDIQDSSFNGNYLSSRYSNQFENYGGVIYALGDLNINNSNFTDTGGYDCDYGAVIYTEGSTSINNSYFYNNVASNSGGVIYSTGSDLNINNSKFKSNSASKIGGVIFADNFNVENCVFENNRAETGGVIYGDLFNVSNSNFRSNRATTFGGAIYGEFCEIVDSNFTYNHAVLGGAIYSESNTIDNCNFSVNNALKGGAIFALNNNNISNSSFNNNYAYSFDTSNNGGLNNIAGGAAVYLNGDNNVIDKGNFIENSVGSISEMVPTGVVSFNKTRLNKTHYLITIHCNISFLDEVNVYDIVGNIHNSIVHSKYDLKEDNSSSFMSYIDDGSNTREFTIDDNITEFDWSIIYPASEKHNWAVRLSIWDGVHWDYKEDCCEVFSYREGYGGAIASVNGHNNNLTNSRFINNSAFNQGGSIAVFISDLSIDNCQFVNSSAAWGSTIYASNQYVCSKYNEYTGDFDDTVVSGDNTVDVKNSGFDLNKVRTLTEIAYDKVTSEYYVKFTAGNNYINGIYSNNSVMNIENVVFDDNTQISNLNNPEKGIFDKNHNITVEIYDFEDKLISNVTYKTNDDGFVYPDSTILFDDTKSIGYIKAYSLEDECLKYSQDEYTPIFGEFDYLQYLINQVEENGTLVLDRDYVYSLDLDTITDGLLILKNNITIDCNGYTIDAQNKSSIFRVIGNNTKLINIKAANPKNDDGNIVYVDNAANTTIENTNFNIASQVTSIYVDGGDLTVNNCEFNFTNYVDSIREYPDKNYTVKAYGGCCGIEVNTSGNIVFSKSKFRNSVIYYDGIIYIVHAGNLTFDGVEFSNNLGLAVYYDINETSGEPYIAEYQEGDVGTLIYANASNINILNSVFKNNTIRTFANLETDNLIINNLNVSDSCVKTLFDSMFAKTAEIDSLIIDNLDSTSYGALVSGKYFDTSAEYLMHICSKYSLDSTNYRKIFHNDYLSFRNVEIKNMHSGHEYLIFLEGNNVALDNVNISEYCPSQNVSSFDENGVFQGMNESSAYPIYMVTNNVDISNVNFDHIKANYGLLMYIENKGNASIMNVSGSNVCFGMTTSLIAFAGNDVDRENCTDTITVKSLSFANLTTEYIQSYSYGDSEYQMYYCYMGVGSVYVSDQYANISVSDISIIDSVIAQSISVSGKNSYVHDIVITNSSMLNCEKCLYVTAKENATVENILFDNLDISELIEIYYYNGKLQENESGIMQSSPSIYIESYDSVNLNNINITNSISMGGEGLIIVGAGRNISVADINLENITGTTQYEKYVSQPDMIQYYNATGAFNNGLNFNSKNGTVDISKLNVNNVESCGEKFFDVIGGDIVLKDISVTNTTTNGKGGSILINATGNLTIDNFSLDNYSLSNGTLELDYHPSHHRYIYNYDSRGCGAEIGIAIFAENADIQNMNLTNIIIGGDPHENALLFLLNVFVSHNLTANNIVIDNITTKDNVICKYNDTLGRQIYENISESISGGLQIKAGNATISNVVANNLVTRDSQLFQFSADDDLKVYNVTFFNIDNSGAEGVSDMAGNNIIVENFSINNVTSHTTLKHSYYNPYVQKYIYEYRSHGHEDEFSVAIYGKNANISNIELTNIEGGGVEGILSIRFENLTLSEVLIDNIINIMASNYEYYSEYDDYFYNNMTGIVSGGISIDSNESSISNVKINDIVFTDYNPAMKIVGNNTHLDNVTVSNAEYLSSKDIMYNPDYDKYINGSTSKGLNAIYVGMNGAVDINELDVENITGLYRTIEIEGIDVTINNSSFKNINTSFDNYIFDDGDTYDYVIFEHDNYGHGVYVAANNTRISNTEFENMDVGGNGLYVVCNISTLLDNCSFSNIKSSYSKYSLLNTNPLTYEYEQQDANGGAVYIDGGNNRNIKNSSFINCSADYGGAIYADVPLNITGSKFINNTAKHGGAIYVSGNGLKVNNSYFEGNNATDGGAMYFAISAYNNTVYNSTFSKNLAENNGGALYIYETTEDGINLINASKFYDNHANHNGGAYFFNDAINGKIWDDYRWHNATASSQVHDDLTFISEPLSRTMIIFSEFERNSDYSLDIKAHDNAVGGNHTVTITIDEIAEGYIDVNITDEAGNYVKDKDGNEINGKYLIKDGKVTFELEDLPVGKYNVSAQYTGWEYGQYSLYYHVNSTVFEVYPHDLNVTVTKTAYADENITVTAKLNNHTTGTVNITVTNGTFTKTYSYIPVVNGTVEYNITGFYAGDYNVTVTYNGDDTFYSKSNTTNFAVKQRKSSMDVEVRDNVYGNATKIIVKVPENQTGNVTLLMDNVNIKKEVTNGTVEFDIENLTVKEWEANITFNENRVYSANSTVFKFNVTKANLTADVVAKNITTKDNASFGIVVTDDFKGNVTIKIGNTTYYDGPVTELVNITSLAKGEYSANVTFHGDDNYNGLSVVANFTVEGVEPEMTVEITNTTYGKNATATITVSNNANGTVNITVDDKNYTAVIKNGSGSVNIDNVTAGVKEAQVKFVSSDGYNSNASANASFTVMVANSTLTISNKTSDVVINVTKDAKGNVTVYVNGDKYIAPIVNGTATVPGKLHPGENSVVAIWDGDDNYMESSNSTRIIVGEVDPNKLTANITITNQSRDVVVELPNNATGDLTVYVNGEKHTPSIESGKAIISNVLVDGDNSVVVNYGGDSQYYENVAYTKISLPVSPTPSQPFNITVTDLISSKQSVVVEVNGSYDGEVMVICDSNSPVRKNMENGFVSIPLNGLSTGDHEVIVITPDGSVNRIMISSKPSGNPFEITTIKAENMTRGYNSPYDYQAVFLDKSGNALVNAKVAFIVNGKQYNVTTNKDGIAQLTGAKLKVGKYNITSVNLVTGEEDTKVVQIVKRILENKDLTMDFMDGSKFRVKVIGDNGKVAPAGEVIDISVNGVHYAVKVDKNGYATLAIKLAAKKYKISAEYNGYKTTNNLVVKKVVKAVKKVITVKKSAKSFTIKATLKWSNGKAISGKIVYFKIKGKTFKAKVNKKGVATVKISKKIIKTLKKGKKYPVVITYKVKYKYGKGYVTVSDVAKCTVKVK